MVERDTVNILIDVRFILRAFFLHFTIDIKKRKNQNYKKKINATISTILFCKSSSICFCYINSVNIHIY